MANRRTNDRVQFEHQRVVCIMSRDGKWQRPCTMRDVSTSGAKLQVEGPLDGLDLKDFYLVLTKLGKAHRRCSVVWQKDGELGVRFIKPKRMSNG